MNLLTLAAYLFSTFIILVLFVVKYGYLSFDIKKEKDVIVGYWYKSLKKWGHISIKVDGDNADVTIGSFFIIKPGKKESFECEVKFKKEEEEVEGEGEIYDIFDYEISNDNTIQIYGMLDNKKGLMKINNDIAYIYITNFLKRIKLLKKNKIVKKE